MACFENIFWQTSTEADMKNKMQISIKLWKADGMTMSCFDPSNRLPDRWLERGENQKKYAETVNRWIGRIGVRKSAGSCLFFGQSVNPPLFSFKSESALFRNFLWHIFTATDGRCCFLCQCFKDVSFYCLLLRQLRQHTEEGRLKWTELRLVSTIRACWHEE